MILPEKSGCPTAASRSCSTESGRQCYNNRPAECEKPVDIERKSAAGADSGFSEGGGANPLALSRTILPNFPKKCMKLRTFRTVGTPLPRSATALNNMHLYFPNNRLPPPIFAIPVPPSGKSWILHFLNCSLQRFLFTFSIVLLNKFNVHKMFSL